MIQGTDITAEEIACGRFVEWLEARVVRAGKGDELGHLDVEPDGKFWFGRIASEAKVMASGLGERGERLEPCAIGIRCRPLDMVETRFHATVRCCVWVKRATANWDKLGPIAITIDIVHATGEIGPSCYGGEIIATTLAQATGARGLSAEIRIETEQFEGQRALTILLVNTSPETHPSFADTTLYECELEIGRLATVPFLLAALPDSFRYDRRIPAYGVNSGVRVGDDGSMKTVDAPRVDRRRPVYWNVDDKEPDLSFTTLGRDPLPSLDTLSRALRNWGQAEWSDAALHEREVQSEWNGEMSAEASRAAAQFAIEASRLERGIELLYRDETIRTAFTAMNRSMAIAAHGAYDGWRPFQIGFQLMNLASIVDTGAEANHVDVVWFATGGGKTETYLGHILTAAFFDRITGKSSGITAWSRFPLRMLSLQQTQRFANALAGGELIRRESPIDGDPFSLGFLVGQGATPNSIKPQPKEDDFDPDDEDAPKRYQILMRCPFCRQKSIEMGFDRRLWRLEHRCKNESCSWPERALPFYVVDDEIYRFLPTVIVGTLDKAAAIAMQASMRGFVGAPLGRCSEPGHGYVYSPRSTRPHGCLVPDCPGAKIDSLGMPAERFPPSFRLQDELHLLRDSLGAVDAHYEALYDSLQAELAGRKQKILASSATLTGYEKQVDVLYGRAGRVFPEPPPAVGEGFWTADSARLMRRYLAVTPRGQTVEYMVDRMLTELQGAIRELVANPTAVCAAAGIDKTHADLLVSLYGTQVVYGTTLRDLDAVQRSLATAQVPVQGDLNSASLTGRDQFEDVLKTQDRLEMPEEAFDDRLHIITASAMMSHGVDIDRLNVMVMLGLPLTAAEFIQATARVGRRWPGLVFVVHKIGRERDAGVFRSFEKFVEQGDRFVEPVPVTKRSRRVLECTMAGLVFARILMLAEPSYGRPLTTIARFRDFIRSRRLDLDSESAAIIRALRLDDPIDEPMREAIQRWFEDFSQNIENPPPNVKWPNDLSPSGSPMISLRDVEQSVPVSGSRL